MCFDVKAWKGLTHILGSRFSHGDVYGYRNWALLTTTGAYTYGHKDGSGLATYVYVTQGCKLWGYLRLKVPSDIPAQSERPVVSEQSKRRLRSRTSADVMLSTHSVNRHNDEAFLKWRQLAGATHEYRTAYLTMPTLVETKNLTLLPGDVLCGT